MPDFSLVDEESAFEAFLTRNVCEPSLKLLPRSLKPNLISVVNILANLLQVYLAFVSVSIDESADEAAAGQMHAGRQRDQVRWTALQLRIAMGVLVFLSMVLDCLDGMHARATQQCSSLGEVVDHALDSANIPLIASGFLVAFSADDYTVMVSMVACNFVFNGQLVIYRRSQKFIKPPTNGPEAQMSMVVAQICLALLCYVFGRWSTVLATGIVGFCICGNIVQVRNILYFWSFFESWRVAGDHIRFCVINLLLAALFITGHMSVVAFVLGNTIMAFRLNGAYVLFIVTNKCKAKMLKDADTAQVEPVRSALSSSYSGLDLVVSAYVIAVYAMAYMWSPGGKSALPVERYELVTITTFMTAVTAVFVSDLKRCLPYLLPSYRPEDGVLSLFF